SGVGSLMRTMARRMSALLVSLCLAAAAVGCATPQGEASSKSTTPAGETATAKASCSGCEKGSSGCARHAEAGPKDDKGNPVAPTEGHDLPCDASCCK